MQEKQSEFLVSRVTTGAATLNVEISAAYFIASYLIGIAIIAASVVLASWTVFPFEAERYSFKDELRRYKTMSIMEIKGVRYSYDNKQEMCSKRRECRIGRRENVRHTWTEWLRKDNAAFPGLGGLDSPLEGQILFDRQDIEITGLAAHRKNNVAFIFQSYNLIDYLTPKENVALTS